MTSAQEKDYIYNEGMLHAYDMMDKTIAGAIKRNGGATTALQIINVFNEFTSHLHYQKSLTQDRVSEWQESVDKSECEEPTVGGFDEETQLFSHEIKALTDLLGTFGYVQLKGAN